MALSPYTMRAVEHYRKMLLAERRASRSWKQVLANMSRVPPEDLPEFHKITQDMIEQYDEAD